MPNYFTIPEFASLKNTTRLTIYNAINRNELDTANIYDKQLIRRTKKNDKWMPIRPGRLFKQLEIYIMPDYFTIIEFAKLKNTTRQTIYNAIKRSELDIARMYGKQLIRKTKTNDKWLPVEHQKRYKKRSVK